MRRAWCADCRPETLGCPVLPRTALRLSALPTEPASPPYRNRMGRCPDISWVGSRRTGSYRRVAVETIEGARSHTGGPASTETRYPERAQYRALARRTELPVDR